MCGISGFNKENEELIMKMVNATQHRGPDGAGFFTGDGISLGHNLLAITDNPSGAKQPLESPDKNYVLIYNGEIYNFKALRDSLKESGFIFRTESDTEVLLSGLIKEGINFLKKVNGMFAFAFFDRKNKKLILARDGKGMRPLYYFHKSNTFIFASELRAIFAYGVARTLNIENSSIFFELGYLPGPATLIKDIYKLCPGQYAEFNLKNNSLYLDWFSSSSKSIEKHEFNPDQFQDILGQSVIDHTMGLRPFGMYLSGGLDSSIVLYELLRHGVTNLTTYTTRFEVDDPRFNEDADIAKKLSVDFKTDHHEFFVREQDFMDALPRVIETIEEPRYHPSIPAYYLMAREASKDIVVVITGDGGDESFMGYPKYKESYRISRRYEKYPDFLLNLYYTLRDTKKGKIPLGFYMDLQDVILRWWQLNKISSYGIKDLFKFKIKPQATINYLKMIKAPAITHPTKDMENAIAELDRLFWLAEDSFMITDKIGMHFGMEGRFPFSDSRVIDYAAGVPSRNKILNPKSKGLLRQAYRDKLPSYVTEKRKSGWTAPVVYWMNSKLGQNVREVLTPDFYEPTSSLFNLDIIQKNIRGKDKFEQLDLKSFFPIYLFQIWAEKFKITL